MAPLEIAQLGNPILRQQALALTPSQLRDYAPFFVELEKTMLEYNGIGIAAPQVSKSIRSFIVASSPNPRYPNAPQMEPTLILNPELIWSSQETEVDWEGCLSIPGMRARVERPKHIEVHYTTLNGSDIHCQMEGFIARIFQHELDHLNGIVFLDRAKPKDYFTEAEFLKLVS
ncbi:peptide deformylase [Photobacterium sp. SDRW27]|uniref:peptide deformylase n=1 Tax=Photobacterium obscurum TaxID=2829490 RepID=UPI002242E8C3|nr:peptide deformylase [Photobacterium obscurum]MCW8328995.1 peptide deformylase [Photobacterium obscurum]